MPDFAIAAYNQNDVLMLTNVTEAIVKCAVQLEIQISERVNFLLDFFPPLMV